MYSFLILQIVVQKMCCTHFCRKVSENKNNTSRRQFLKKKLLWRRLAAFYRYAGASASSIIPSPVKQHMGRFLQDRNFACFV